MEINKKMVVIDLTSKLNNKIEETFVDFPNKYTEKAKFLVWLINRAGNAGYQVHQANHKFFFGLCGGAMSLQVMLNILTKNEIIRRGHGYTIGVKSSAYVIENQYSYAKKTGSVKTYYRDINKIPTFIKRFMTDNYVVKSSANTEFTKSTIINIINKLEDGEMRDKADVRDALIQSQKTEIEILKFKIAELQAELSEYVNKIEDTEEMVISDNHEEVIETPETVISHDDVNDLKNIEFDDFFAPAKPVTMIEPNNIPDILKDDYQAVKLLMSEGMMEYKALDKVCKDDHKLRFDISKYLKTA